jgi:MFS family permease
MALALAGPVIVTAFLAGIGETAMQSLLPLYGLAHGLNDAGAAALVAVFALGEALLVLALGWMADRFGRQVTLRIAAVTATATMVVMPFAVSPFMLHPILFLAGGGISGLYALGVILIGQDFRGHRLAVVSTAFGMAYSAGSIIGATPVGYLIDLFGPEALPASIAVGFTGLAVYLFLPERAGAPALALEDTAGAPTILGVDKRELIDVEEPVVGDLEMGNDRQWQESHLQEWFRERAAELARRRAERDQIPMNALERLQAYQTG